MSQPVLHFDLRRLAIGCLYLLTNKATLYFPSSNRAHPSTVVVVALIGKRMWRDSDRVYFPFEVFWGAWHEAVVPVLENKDVQVLVRDNPSLRVELNRALLTIPDYETLLAKIEGYLLASFIAAGYLPDSFAPRTTVESSSAPSCVPEGEPLDRDPLGPVGIDEGLTHPNGSPKLPYTIVDPELQTPSC